MAKKKDTDKSAQINDKNKSDQELDENEEPNFDDPPDYVDNVTDEDLLGSLLLERPEELDSYDTVIVVDGIPQVGPERFEKLQNVINKTFSKYGKIINEYYAKDDNNHSKGYVFLEYEKTEFALEAVAKSNGHKLDKNHTLLVNLFTDFKKYEEIPDKWEPPEPTPYKEQKDLHYYLLNADAYDQFCVFCYGGNPVQLWLNSLPVPTKIEERARWTEIFVHWSPNGTYIATMYSKGVALWGGPNFEKLKKLAHSDVQFVEFSPCENYLVTYSPNPINLDQTRLIIWDIRRGEAMRSFALDERSIGHWPFFKWSKDDKYFARVVGQEMISIYETPSFGLLDKKSIKVPGIRDFEWSPTDNILAYWVAEENTNAPARVVLLEIPSRNEIRAHNVFNVCSCKIHWQKSGDYLCVKVDRYAKKKVEKNELKYTGLYFNFEIFHLREKSVPLDSVEIKEQIHAFAWEPIGSKFAIIHGEVTSATVSFYGLKLGHKPVLLKRLDKRSHNTLFWSPIGQFIVLADLRGQGSLEFIDTHEFTIMNSTIHYKCTNVEWDPTGRYVVTATSMWKTKEDTGYWIWTFQGRTLNRINLAKFCQLLWRPRPLTLLSAEQQRDIKKNLKKYSAEFEAQDKIRQMEASKELFEKRAASMKKFEEFRQSRLGTWGDQKKQRLELRNNIDTDELDSDVTNMEEEIVEFIINEEIIPID